MNWKTHALRRLVTLATLVATLAAFAGCFDTSPPPDAPSTQGNGGSGLEAPSFEAAEATIETAEPYRPGLKLNVRVKHSAWDEVDSISLFLDNQYLCRAQSENLELNTADWPLGEHALRTCTWKEKTSRTTSERVTLYAAQAPRKYGYRVLGEFPHDEQAYTQGLLWLQGYLYESTGVRGASSLRRVKLEDGGVTRMTNLEPEYFGEGLALHGGRLYQLTWTSRTGFIYDTATFKPLGTFSYSTQGWGLASDGEWLYMSDGTENIYQIAPDNFRVVRTIQVNDDKGPQVNLNELEMIEGLLYANVFMSDEIVAIDPASGCIMHRIDMSGLLPGRLRGPRTDVLNGIAYDSTRGAIYVTGKNWPRLYRVEFVER